MIWSSKDKYFVLFKLIILQNTFYSVVFLVQFYRHNRHIIIYNFYLCICKNTA